MVIATIPADPALHPDVTQYAEPYVFSCDYNGWADVPEEEREGIDAFEAAGPPSASITTPPIVEQAMQWLPVRWKEARSSEPGAGNRRAA
jgi:hypothetical protein